VTYMGDITELNVITRENKQKWFGDGEWVDEPDYVEFTYNGYLCKVYRVCKEEMSGRMFGGYLCGYVCIPNGHPLHGKDLTSIDGEDHDLDVHGGVTYSGDHLYDQYMIGFDCAHSYDIVPSMIEYRKEYDLRRSALVDNMGLVERYNSMFPCTYKNIEYVTNECKSLVDQIKNMGKDGVG
jgi:hypothetical protein